MIVSVNSSIMFETGWPEKAARSSISKDQRNTLISDYFFNEVVNAVRNRVKTGAKFIISRLLF